MVKVTFECEKCFDKQTRYLTDVKLFQEALVEFYKKHAYHFPSGILTPYYISKYIDGLFDREFYFKKILKRAGFKYSTEEFFMGKFLYMMAKSVNAKRVLELGTQKGFSATWLGEAVSPDGLVDTYEINKEFVKIATINLRKIGLDKTVRVIDSDVMVVLPVCEDNLFDLIYNDLDKEVYPKVLEDCIRVLKVGGLLITDNLLWSGMVASDSLGGSRVKAIKEYNKMICNHPKLVSLILPCKDGIGLSIKIGE
jgi:predicted O-methyltransferase YrrM